MVAGAGALEDLTGAGGVWLGVAAGAGAAELGVGPIGSASVGGASDGNFAAAAGARVLDGLGAVGEGAHAPHEHILVSSVEGRIDLLSRFIKELM